ncbi:MAG: glycosyltransferase family 4 protein [Planctomycetota bacterium]
MSAIRVVVLTEDPDGPSVRHRWRYAAPYLEHAGVAIEILPVQPAAAREAAFEAAAAADLTVVHRKMFRWPDLRRLVAAVRDGKRRRLVFDLDDAVMYRASGRWRQWSILRRLRFARNVGQASVFLAGNAYLKSQSPIRIPSVIVPTPVDLPRYRPREEWPGRARAVGWIGTASTLPYLDLVEPALRELAANREDFVLRVIGDRAPRIDGVTVEAIPWSEDGEAEALRGLDVGILPLPDDRWTRGKCAFKALQYMATGLPVVASPVGMNREVVTDGETGRLATTTKEWVAALDGLLDDAAARERMGAAGRARVEADFATKVVAAKTADILKGHAR